MRKIKTVFLLAVAFFVAAGFAVYMHKHGIVDTSGEVGISADYWEDVFSSSSSVISMVLPFRTMVYFSLSPTL